MSLRHARLLAAAVTDKTFAKMTLDGQAAWVGKCIHCGKKLVVRDDGRAMSGATLEHVRPRRRGGTNAIENLAVACAACNREKGKSLDATGGPRFEEVTAALAAKRMERWRDPDTVKMAARLAGVLARDNDEDDE